MARREAAGTDLMSDDDQVARARLAQRGSPFLSPEQAAHYLGVSVRTLQEHRSAGTGPRFRRHSRHVRYHIDDLDSWSLGVSGKSDRD
jgi:hypothetical protein